ncbi:hypothetical protein ACFL2V_02885 [Pseudomonadota bacterium]
MFSRKLLSDVFGAFSYREFLLAFSFICLALVGCKDKSEVKFIPTDRTISAESHLNGVFPQVTITAELSNGESGVMEYDADGLETITFYNLEEEEYSLTRRYYLGDILLGVVTDSFFIDEMISAISISLNSQLFDGNYDDDIDGWTNVAELQWGSDIENPFSYPPSNNTKFTITSGGGASYSAQYKITDRIGKVTDNTVATSTSYSSISRF